jgi:serine phosphatase RsbU (regulator of sigma subunit)
VGQVCIGLARGVLTTLNLQAQISALVFISVLITVVCLLRNRVDRKLAQSRSVAAVAQRVLLQPLPERSGPLRIASFYLPAEEEAEMGGDLYAAARTDNGTRLLIGDVRGKGLPGYNNAALLLGAFRAAAHRQVPLTELAFHLDGAMRWDAAQWTERGEAAESFATALLLDIPDRDHVVHAVHLGHPPPLLLSNGRATALETRQPGLPIGLGNLAGSASCAVETCRFAPGDLLLLYTDGVSEARDAEGVFYPPAERAAAWTAHGPRELLERLHEDLRAHTGGRLGDDAAAIAVRRDPEVSSAESP